MKTIGKLAEQAEVGVETIRFYERKGLIKQPKKAATGGFRTYPDEDALKIKFIKRAQELGFTLAEVKELLSMNANPKATCKSVGVKATAKLEEVESKIADLTRMRDSLKILKAACSKNEEALACCRIIECFEGNC